MNMLYLHHPNEAAITRECAVLVSQARETGIPVVLEALPFGIGRPDDYTPANIAFAVRQAAELGADVVKTAYPGDQSAFRDIVASCYVPVIVLGGAAGGDDASVLRMVEQALAAGASGVAIGRNVWQRPDPAAMAKAIAGLVHGG
jgi:DhnA family fructose-bisphosphate aldolase class Ia